MSTILLLIALGAASAREQPERPAPTTGSVALLSLQPLEEALPAIRSAVAASDSTVRAVAARVAAVIGAVELGQTISDALNRESDPRVAAEQIRALTLLGSGSMIPVLEATAARLGGPAMQALNEWRARDARAGSSALQRAASARTAEIWWPGLLGSIAGAAGCRPGNLVFGYVNVTYSADGRPTRLAVDTQQLPRECHAVLNAVGRLSLPEADRAVTDGQTQWILVPLGPAAFACAERDGGAPLRVGRDGVATPRKSKDMPPSYPARMMQERVQGMVTLEAVIAPTGCTRSARVLKGVHPILDLAAVQAVSQWEFEPVTVQGRAVPVVMMVTVRFSMQ